MKPKLDLSILPETLAVCRLNQDSQIPEWTLENSTFFAITKTREELSIVCEQALVPEDIKAEKDWRAFKVEGPLDFSLTGILADLSTPLAVASLSIFAISTFDTDYILVKSNNLDQATQILSQTCNILD